MFLHRFTKLVAVAGFLLVVAGSLVSTTGSGLSLPEWPNVFGRSIATSPISSWTAGIFYQQGHRFIAVAVGLLTIALALAYLRRETRGWVKWLTLVAVGLVVAQGVVGGFAVLGGLPAMMSSTHAGLAQIYFALVVALGVLTSKGWERGYESRAGRSASRDALASDATLRRLSILSIAAIYLQIMLGAVVRHAGAARAIPDYPLAFGRLAPPVDALANGFVAVNFAHRLCALLVAAIAIATAWRILARHRERGELIVPGVIVILLLAAEVVLGAASVLGESIVVGTAQVAAGALMLASAVVVALRVHRPFFGEMGSEVISPLLRPGACTSFSTEFECPTTQRDPNVNSR